jgi:hypothetical protein
MKMRKGWQVIWADGTTWLGDCPRWAAKSKVVGHKVVSIRILGAKRWNCGCGCGY